MVSMPEDAQRDKQRSRWCILVRKGIGHQSRSARHAAVTRPVSERLLSMRALAAYQNICSCADSARPALEP